MTRLGEHSLKVVHDVGYVRDAVAEGLQNGQALRWFASPIEAYCHRDLAIHIHFRRFAADAVEPADFCAVLEWPSELLIDGLNISTGSGWVYDLNGASRHRRRCAVDDAMLVAPVEFMKNPKRRLPARERLQALDLCPARRIQESGLIEPTAPRRLAFFIRLVEEVAIKEDRKLRPFTITASEGADRTHQVVQARSQIEQAITNDDTDKLRRVRSDSDNQHRVIGIRVWLSDDGIRFSRKKVADMGFQLLEVACCPLQLEPHVARDSTH